MHGDEYRGRQQDGGRYIEDTFAGRIHEALSGDKADIGGQEGASKRDSDVGGQMPQVRGQRSVARRQGADI
jgi:hypothetical protein